MSFPPVIVPSGGPVKGGDDMSMTPRSVSLLLCVVAVAAIALLIAMLGDRVMSQTHSLHPPADVLKTEDGQWKYTNALAHETSPYLLQHAHNPVDWHAWGPAAFEAARAAGKPIFLSIGYSTCYWCHVMERQCFENPRIAAQMNEQFICIKVDREERPDIDDIYMAATVMITRGRGGWPMSVFLTPPGTEGPDDRGLKPFFAGTYFPPAPLRGSPGFPQLMDHLSQLWETRRNDLAASADQIAEYLVAYLGRRDADGDLEKGSIQAAADQLTGSYDPVHGGFGSAPKFPTPNNLQFLLRVYGETGSAELGNALRHTLDRMARGGMYDQVGGGFHRYSVDDRWLVPHFEKMLYDNGQLVEVYLDADARLPDKDDPQARRRVVREICDYVLREMTDPTGTFWSAEDAEVDAREGGSYLWTPDEVNVALDDAELAAQASVMYGLDQGTNFTDPHAPDAPPANVLYLPVRLDDLASRWNLSVNDVAKLRQRINTRLYAARSQRKQPGTDDKVLTAWNGIMVAAMATAGRVLEETRYLDAAATAARYILDNMRSSDGGLYRSMRGGKVKIEGFLEDYAYFVHALVALYHADNDGPWLAAAIELTDEARRRFGAEGGGYYDTLADQPDLIVRTRGTSDTAIPSGNSQMVHNLVDLHEATGQEGYLAMARRDLQSFAGSLANQGAGMAHMQHALLRVFGGGPGDGMAAGIPRPGTFSSEPRLGIEVEPAHVDLSGGTGRARVMISIPQPYHLNAHDPGLEGLIGMRFEIRPADGLTLSVHYPMGQSTHFAYSDIPINVYAGTIDIELDFVADGGEEGGFSPRLFLKYQLCGEHACLAPAETPVPLRLTYGTSP